MVGLTTTVLARGARGDWLSLGEASLRLGVHPDTLRRWADARRVATWVTPGGHRRFTRSSLDALTARIRHEPAVRDIAEAVDDAIRTALRERGVLLVRLLRAYASTSNERERARYLAQAEECGAAYGRDVRASGVALATAVRVVLKVRAHVLRELPAAAPAFDCVLVALSAGYASADAADRATIEHTAP